MSSETEKQNKDDHIDDNIPANVAILPEGVAITAIKMIKNDPYDASRINTRELFREIYKQECEIEKGNFRQIERHLYSQAIALNALFDRMLAQLAHAEFTPHVQLSGMLALKAQAQCRATLATLAQIKNPDQITFIKQNIQQQNNAINQQVNTPITNNSKKSEKIANELLKESKHEALEFRGKEQAIAINPAVETMETINRSNDSGRKGN